MLGITWPRMSTRVVTEIEDFLSQKYRHHEEEPDAVLENPRLSGWLRSAYQVLGHWARAGEDPGDFFELDRIRMDMNSAAPAFSRLIMAGHAAAEKVTESHRELTRTKAALAKAEAKLARVEEVKEAVKDKAKRLEVELRDARRRIREVEKQVEKLNARQKAPGAATRDAPAAAGTGGSAN